MENESISKVAKIFSEKSQNLEKELDKIKHLNEMVRSNVAQFVAAINKTQKALNGTPEDKCPICCSRDRNYAFVPCGHIVCSVCCRRAQRSESKCFTCRTNIENIIRIYI